MAIKTAGCNRKSESSESCEEIRCTHRISSCPFQHLSRWNRKPSALFLCPAVPIRQKGQEMKKRVNGFTANYNGEAIRPDEVMVPFEYTNGDAENCTNAECIRTVKMGGRNFKVIYKAVPQAWEKEAKSAFNLVQNETLGHYDVPNSVSMDGLKDEYELELGSTPSAEETYMADEDMKETLNTFVELIHTLIEKSAKFGYAVLLMHTGVKGEEFYSKMKLSRNPANLVQQQAQSILRGGLANVNVSDLKGYKNQYEEEYRAEAYKLLDKIIKMYR